VDQIVARLDQENGRFGALLMGIIESAPFQEQRNRANAAFAGNHELSTTDNASQLAKRQASP